LDQSYTKSRIVKSSVVLNTNIMSPVLDSWFP